MSLVMRANILSKATVSLSLVVLSTVVEVMVLVVKWESTDLEVDTVYSVTEALDLSLLLLVVSDPSDPSVPSDPSDSFELVE